MGWAVSSLHYYEAMKINSIENIPGIHRPWLAIRLGATAILLLSAFLSAGLVPGALFDPAMAQAEINVASSLEWMTVRSSVVAIGLLDFVKTTERKDGGKLDQWSLTVTKALKGTPGEKVSFFVSRPAEVDRPQAMFDTTSEFAVFLVIARGDGIDPAVAGKLVPSSEDSPMAVFDLDKPAQKLFRISGRKVESREEILEAVAETSSAYQDYLHSFSPKIKRNYLEMKPETDAYKALWSGSAVYLLVPSFMSKDSKEAM